MTGVEILTSNEVVTKSAFNWTAFWVVGGLILVAFIIIGVFVWASGECEWNIMLILLITGMGVGAIFGSMVGDADRTPIEYVTQYQVTISDEVSMAEFCERYTIIRQDGKVFTVMEK